MRVLVVAGASGGHIYPALSFLAALEREHKDIRTLFVVPRRGMGDWIVSRSRAVRYVSTVPLVAYPPGKAALSLFNFLKGCAQALEIMMCFRPSIVIGFGSLDSIPLVVIAWLFRIKTMVHEQNVRMGKANAFLAHIADKIAISSAETRLYLGPAAERTVVTGNPLRPGLKNITREQALRFFGFEEGKTTLLAVGGSQGSSRINTVFAGAVVSLPEKENLQIIHIAGRRDHDSVAKMYENGGVRVKVLGYLNQMEFAYSICDAVVSRAGATTISELAYFKIPAILIPYPFAREHQAANASVLEKAGAAVQIADDALNADVLGAILRKIIAPTERARMRAAYDALPAQAEAAERLVEEALALAGSSA